MRFPWSRPTPDVDERLEKLERAVRDMQVDWDQTYEKFRLLMARLGKRDKRAAMELPTPADDDGVDPISRQILLERGTGNGLRTG